LDLKLLAIHWLNTKGNNYESSNTIVSKMTPSAVRIAANFHMLHSFVKCGSTTAESAEVCSTVASVLESEIGTTESETRVAEVEADKTKSKNSKILQEVINDLITFLEIPSYVALKDAQDHILQKLETRPCAWNSLTYLEINARNTSVLRVMYSDPATREYARDIMRLILRYIHETCPDFTYGHVHYIDMDTVTMPALIRQLQQSIHIIGDKSLLATAIELNDHNDIDMILRCQGVNIFF